MKLSIIIVLSALIFVGCSNGQPDKNAALITQPQTNKKEMDKLEYSFQIAHPKAQALMPEDFYWSPIEETAPFGSDDGSDAAYGFKQWRSLNKAASPVVYLKELIAEWNYPYFDYNEMDTTKIKAYISSKSNPDEATTLQQMEMMRDVFKNSTDTSDNNLTDKELRDLVISTSRDLGGSFLLGQDNAIIGISFAQFVTEGRIDKDIQALTTTAIQRQLLPMLLNRYDNDYRMIRQQQLTKMLAVIDQANL